MAAFSSSGPSDEITCNNSSTGAYQEVGMSSGDELESLAEKAREGSSEAWAELYEANAPAIFRLCRRALNNRHDAEDATAAVFLKARLHLNQFDASRPFAPWIYRVAANHCWDELRKRRTHGEWDDGESELQKLEDQAPTPQQAVLLNETKRNVRNAIAARDDRSRLIVILRYFAEMSYEEIGDVLGISSNFTGVLLLRARRQMRTRLKQ